MNYQSLGNRVRHFHLHIVPRYMSLKKFENTEFLDNVWGSPPDKYVDEDKSRVSEEISQKLIEKIKANL